MNSQLPGLAHLWRPTVVSTDEWSLALARFRGISLLTYEKTRDDRLRGHIIWGTVQGKKSMAVCWAWEEMFEAVVALADPLAVFSNARLVGQDGQALDDRQTLLTLHNAIYQFPWQNAIANRIGQRGRAEGALRNGITKLVRRDQPEWHEESLLAA